jgi:SWI/SNF-related matrix-associated actin-dependent regulator of chromatin subfamily A member 5
LKRYRYLLGQTDLFAHFLDLKTEKDEAMATVLEEKRLSKSEDG